MRDVRKCRSICPPLYVCDRVKLNIRSLSDIVNETMLIKAKKSAGAFQEQNLMILLFLSF